MVEKSPSDRYQPQAPDLGAAVHLETAATLDGPAGDVDGLDASYVPPDRPYVSLDDEVSARGMHEGESLDERLRREEPEEQPVDPNRAGRLEATGDDDLSADDVGVAGGAASAEEAAVHVTGDGVGLPAETEPRRDVVDPAADVEVERAERDAAARIDALRDAGGAAAPASGRADAGEVPGL